MKGAKIFLPAVAVLFSWSVCTAEVLVDQLDSLDRLHLIVSTKSQINTSEIVSYFEIQESAALSKLVWSGSLRTSDREGVVPDPGGEPFIIRIYGTMGERPALEPAHELSVQAMGETVPQPSVSGAAIFTAEQIDNVELRPGGYWIAFLYAGSADLTFSLSIEPGGATTIYGSGGALRDMDTDKWTPPNSSINFFNSRGYSMRIHGTYIDTGDDPGYNDQYEIIEGDLSIVVPYSCFEGGKQTISTVLFPVDLDFSSFNPGRLFGTKMSYLSVINHFSMLYDIVIHCFALEEASYLLRNDLIIVKDKKLLIPIAVLSEEDSKMITSKILIQTGEGEYTMRNLWNNWIFKHTVTLKDVDYIKFKNTPLIQLQP